jgi:feruloyl esterase
MHLGSWHQAKSLYANPEAWIGPPKVKTLVGAVYSTCDGLDGLKDGVVSNIAGCNKAFSIDTVRATLRCPDGRDAGDSCLSDQQIATVDAIDRPFSLGFPTMAGLSTYPKWPILEGATFLNNTLGATAVPSLPPALTDAFQYRVATATIRYVITRNPTMDPLKFDPKEWAQRITEVSQIWDANSVDLSQFMSKGGKVILVVGTIDDSITSHNSIDYYKRLVTRFGQSVADSFSRFYVIPGYGHGNGVFNAKFDALGALDAWVDRGLAPQTLEAVDINSGNNNRTRPMCVYPGWPQYAGSGDPDSKTSFRCVTEADGAPQTR